MCERCGTKLFIWEKSDCSCKCDSKDLKQTYVVSFKPTRFVCLKCKHRIRV